MKTNEKDITGLCNSYGRTDLQGRPVQYMYCPDGSSIECAVYTVKGAISGEMISPKVYRAVFRIDHPVEGGHVTDEYLMEVFDPDDFRGYIQNGFGVSGFGASEFRYARWLEPTALDARMYDGLSFHGYGRLDECIAWFGCSHFDRGHQNEPRWETFTTDPRWVPDLISMGFAEDWGERWQFDDVVVGCYAGDDCKNPGDLADDLLERYGTTWWDGSNMHYLILANEDIADDFQDGDRWDEDGTRYIPFDC